MKKAVQVKATTHPVVVRRTAASMNPALSSRSMRKGATVFAISENSRPRAGKALYAHTNAAFTALGMLAPARPAVPKRDVLTLMGQRAVTHHLNEGNLEALGDEDEEELRLTPAGYRKFTERQQSLDAPLANSFLGLILEGKTDGTDVPQAQVYPIRF